MSNYDFVIIAPSIDPVYKRAAEICEYFKHSFCGLENIDLFSEAEAEVRHSLFILCSATKIIQEGDVAGQVQVMRHMSPDAFITVVVNSKMSPEQTVFVKKSGANLVLLESEVLMTSKLDFVVSQKIKSIYTPVKVSELIVGTKMDCNLYHLLSMNKKYLPVITKNTEFTEAKLEKLKPYSEIYIRKDCIDIYQTYLEKNMDRSARGLASRCRNQFLNLSLAYIDLVLLVLDQTEHASFDLGRKLYEKCEKLSSDLMGNLSAVGEAWDIITNSSVDDFGSVERGPAVAAYAGLMCLNSGICKMSDVMVAALLSDIGLLELNPKITLKMRNNEESKFNSEELQEYQNHPLVSLNRALSRRLPLTEEIKNGILYSHERVNGLGFPNKIRGDRVTKEAMFVQLAELIDRSALIRLGETRPDIKEVKRKIYDKELANREMLSFEFLEKVGPYLKE